MFGISGYYLLGYEDGKSSERSARASEHFWNRISQRGPVEVDQSYIDAIHANVQAANASAQKNYDACQNWIERAEALEKQVAALKSQVAEINRVKAERDGLRRIMDLAGHLLQAQRAGKASKPEFAELREFTLKAAYIHLRGGIYEGLGRQPEKFPWLDRVWDALS